jgi:para-nitrobenzyl esterase
VVGVSESKTTVRIEADTESGTIGGIEARGALVFRNVPFAAAPFGERRFEKPQPVPRWQGVRDGTVAGPGYLQGWRREDPWDGYLNPVEQGDDMLKLQVTTPALGGARLPVMVWIHGGGFISGVGSAPAYSGHTFARDGIVHVSVNYRLSLDGYTLLEDSIDTGTENLGLRDQVAALEWVQRNIAAFGGDPQNVTIAGQSAGGVSVGYLLSSPLAEGLFHRAIVESGFPSLVRSIAEAEKTFAAVRNATGGRATRDALRSLSPDESRALVSTLDRGFEGRIATGEATLSDAVFSGVWATESLPVPVVDGLVASTVPLLIGNTRDEGSGFIEKMGLLLADGSSAARAIARAMGAPADAAEVYRASSRSGAGDGEIVNAVFTDVTARMPAIDALSARAGAGWLYEFAWQSPGRPLGLGADHVVDLPFMQHDFAAFRESCAIGDSILGDEPPTALAEAMHGAFAAFVRTGDPGWAPYKTSDRVTMRFDTISEALADPAGAERRIWEGR